jgi:uncharacterized protein with FMN-binding domain
MRLTGKLVAVTATAVAAGLVAGAAPANAAAAFTTPRYGMTCYTGVSGGVGNYVGSATCYAPNYGKWKVRVDCSFGGTYDSIWIYQSPEDGWKTLTPGTSCYWGVNAVQVVEGI